MVTRAVRWVKRAYGAAVGHRLSVGYDEVTALKVFLGTLVGFYLYRRWGCLASGVGPPPVTVMSLWLVQ